MARKTIVELLAEINSLFADNTSGSITPAKLRSFCTDFVDTMTPAYGALSTPGPLAATVGTVDQLMVWSSTYIAQSPEYTTDPATGKITRAQTIASNRISVNIDVDIASNRELTATLYKNGVATPWRAKCSGSGSGRPAILSLDAIDYSDVAVDYQLYVQTDVAGTAVTYSNGIFVVNAVPVRTA